MQINSFIESSGSIRPTEHDHWSCLMLHFDEFYLVHHIAWLNQITVIYTEIDSQEYVEQKLSSNWIELMLKNFTFSFDWGTLSMAYGEQKTSFLRFECMKKFKKCIHRCMIP